MRRLNKTESTIAKGRLLKWTYQGVTQADMLALAQLGQSNSVIRRETKLTDNEINYGLTKAQSLQGLKGGYRRNWANGESEICRRVKADCLAVLRREIQQTLPIRIIHPTPETVKVEA